VRRPLYARPEIHKRTAMRRGAALSAGRPSSFLAVRIGRLALAGGPAAEPSWLQSPRRCPQEHGWASQRAAAGRSSPGGADAGRALVTGSTSSARVRCPVSGASVQCPRVHACPSTRPLSSVRCGHLSVQASGVRCGRPVSICSRVRCVRPGGHGGRRWGRQPRGVGLDLAVVVEVVEQWLGRLRDRPGWAGCA
jgi:hypothetical protein